MEVDNEDLDDMYTVGYLVAFGLLRDSAEAQDCAQEATARAVARWSKVADHATPWVARVSTNLAIGVLRKRRHVEVGLPPGLQIAMAATLDNQAVDRIDLRAALLGLPSRQRQVLVMRYIGDLSDQDIAGAIGCSVGSVKTHTRRGLTALRRRFQADSDR